MLASSISADRQEDVSNQRGGGQTVVAALCLDVARADG
jgi:hypothetical protein